MKLTKEQKEELDAMLSEYVLRANRFVNTSKDDPTAKVKGIFKLLDMKNTIFSYIEKITG